MSVYRHRSAIFFIEQNKTDQLSLLVAEIMQRFFQITAWFLTLAIIFLSLVPPSVRPVTDLPHDLEHFGIFLLTGLAFGVGYPRRYLFQSIALAIFAGLIELAQFLVPERHSRLNDFIVDAVAVGAGIGAAWISARKNLWATLVQSSKRLFWWNN